MSLEGKMGLLRTPVILPVTHELESRCEQIRELVQDVTRCASGEYRYQSLSDVRVTKERVLRRCRRR